MRRRSRERRPLAFVALVAAGLFVVCAGAPPGVRSQPAPSVAPSASASAEPSPAPTPTVEPTPTPFATPTILMLAPDAAPQILWYSFSSTTPHPGDVVTGIVLCSSNVASVELRIAGVSLSLKKTDVGHFEGSYTVPKLPFFMSHNFTMVIVAHNTAGAQVQSNVPLKIR